MELSVSVVSCVLDVVLPMSARLTINALPQEAETIHEKYCSETARYLLNLDVNTISAVRSKVKSGATIDTFNVRTFMNVTTWVDVSDAVERS